jgi:SHS2 domain-containing protein
MLGPMSGHSEVLEHTAEAMLRLRATTLADMLAEAGRALARLELGEPLPPASGEPRPITVRSPDRAALLVDWLNELIYLAETERWVPVEFEMVSATDTAARAWARGVVTEEAPARVKAATFHGLTVVAGRDGLEAEVVLDV